MALFDAGSGRSVRYDALESLLADSGGDRLWCAPVGSGLEDALRLLAAWRHGRLVAPLSARLADGEVRRRAGVLRESGFPGGGGTVFHTSGSSGRAKAVRHRAAAHVLSADGASATIPLHPGCGWLMALPLHHVSGFAVLARCLRAGATVVFPDPDRPLEVQAAHRLVTHVSVVDVQLARLAANGSAYPNLRAVLAGGGPIGPGNISRAIGAGLPLHVTYGMTETASQVATTARLEAVPRVVNAGGVLPGREVAIGSDGGIRVRGGVLGEAVLDGGRWTPLAGADGWFDTGDIGYLDDGNLVVTGRKDRMIISGGENIHPEALEKLLEEVRGAGRVVVVGVADAKWGSRPVAFVSGGAPVRALRDHLGERVEDFMVPDRFLPWPDTVDPAAVKIDHRLFERLAGSA